MLSQEEIDAFKNEGFTFEEIQRIQASLESIERGDVVTEEEAKAYVDGLFVKYKIHA